MIAQMRSLFIVPFLSIAFSCSGPAESNYVALPETSSTIASNSLSNQNVNTFFEDNAGFIWIGTDMGLNRYDGEQYIQFLSNEDSTSISHSTVYKVYQDSRGHIWAGTRNGICRLRDDMRWDRIPTEAGTYNIFDIFESSTGKMYAGNRWELTVYDEENTLFKKIIDFTDYSTLFSSTFLDSNNEIWLVQDRRIIHYDGKTYTVVAIFETDDTVKSAIMDSADRIWLLAQSSITLFDTRMLCFQPAPECISQRNDLLSPGLKAIYKTTSGYALTNDYDELYMYGLDGTLKGPTCLSGDSINAVYSDSRKNLWIGFTNKGFTYINNSNGLSLGEIDLQQRLKGHSVSNIVKMGNGSIVALSDMQTILYLDSTNWKVSEINNLFFDDTRRRIDYILPDNTSENILWLLSDNTIYECLMSENKPRITRTYRTGLTNLHGLFEDSEGMVFCYGQGTDMYYIDLNDNRKTGTFRCSEIALTNITDMVESEKGEIYFCANYRPIYKIDKINLTIDTAFARNNPFYEPTDMMLDSEGKVWITANGSDIRCFTPGTDIIEYISFPASNYNNSVLESSGYLWIGSQNGLYKFDKKTGEYNVFYAGDGIIGNQFNPRSTCIEGNGNLILGGTNGITIVNPYYDSRIREDTPLDIISVSTFSGTYFKQQGTPTSKGPLKLHHKDVSMTFRYASLEFNDYLHARYEYKMEGLDNDWHYVHRQREAFYANVPYGCHTFTVRLVGPDRAYTGIESSIDFRVKRPPLLSIFAMILYFALLSIIACILITLAERNRRKELVIKEKEQQQILNEKNIDFFTNISHEFRTPLTMILGAALDISKSNNISPENQQRTKILTRNARRMQKLVDQLLDINKLENNALKLHVRPFDIISCVRDIVETFRISADSKKIDLLFDSPEDNIIGFVDDDILDKILYNLLSNAIKYTPSGGIIKVCTDIINFDKVTDKFNVASQDKYVRVKVIDSGIGISDDKMEVIFNKFYQLERNRKTGGTGIGLYFAKLVVSLHHGDIICEKAPEGQGCQFTFVLPIGELSYSMEEKSQSNYDLLETSPTIHNEYLPETDYVNEKDNTILIVDDDPEVLLYLKGMFAKDYKVVLRFDAASAYECIPQILPDLIISDVLMLDIDGFEFCRMVKDSLEFSNIPVILLTAKASNEDRIKGIENHADAYVTKPFEPDVLTALVKSLVNKRNDLKEALKHSTVNNRRRLDEILKEKDRKFIEDIYAFMEEELENEELNVTALYKQMCMSRTKFYNKIKDLTGETPGSFFRTYKLNRAKELLTEGDYKISAVAAMTGFCSPSHFTTVFKKQFGMTPKEFISGRESASLE